ncbi:DUF418 domain-containing protein [Streptomonospora salina]|uniref:Putative membrane protein YeiB n=1 Tax=Streptomonospora salina TaxID=104205 RepID=A0A841E8E7_9ACTN|nr:DUF418 domain-containing protein [Streptomonospora salina]MBB5996810.1 putative membrane protein YeiB [Streptomonospora salina]
MDGTPAPVRGPVRPGERAPGPDLARGLMLLLIALANTPWYLYGARQSDLGGHPVDGSALDRAVQFAMLTAVDGRIYPMFACLFGYGLIRIYDRQLESGAAPRAAAAVVRRRNLWLLVFGFVHGALLFFGDILGAYGLLGLVLGWLLLRRSGRTMQVTAAVLVGFSLVLWLFSALGAVLASLAPADASGGGAPSGVSGFLRTSFGEEDYLASAGDRIAAWSVMVPLQAFAVVMPAMMVLGMALGRHRVLERTDRYLRLLTWTAVVGIGAAWLSGLPEALVHVGAAGASTPVAGALSGVRQMSGVLGGAGYVALFGLIGHAVARRGRRGPGTVAVIAVGKRSLSCYLAQSVLCAPLLAAWGLGLGAHFGSASTALFAVAVWLVTLAGAYALERTDRSGPAEVLLRRLSYRSGSGGRGGPAAAGTGPSGDPGPATR